MKFVNGLSFQKLKSYQKPSYPIPKKVWRNPFYFIAFGFGAGTIPYAPGTFGTLMAIPFFILLNTFTLPIYVTLVGAIVIFSIILSDQISKKLQIHDHPGMCLDEFCGFFITMTNAPMSWAWILFGFILFRFFDIVKPWPIRFLDENIGGGLGMILDDIVAGLFSMIIIQIMLYAIQFI